ncbi:hypothetical protein ACFOZ7_22055 [Natribaculum luteum]|uniref:Secreted protein n=1 Tax=Natribaculum luteum TaxID=1586232 RepID=A0ABD5P5L6_9EURY|nr:hypothetical protein [Natribaculum luteum]
MTKTTVTMLVVLLAGLALATGPVAAQPGDAGPSELPSAVPDFVSSLLDDVSDVGGRALADVGSLVERVTPDGVPGLENVPAFE